MASPSGQHLETKLSTFLLPLADWVRASAAKCQKYHLNDGKVMPEGLALERRIKPIAGLFS
ncbi:MAG: hypothetical protein QME90_11005 [Thermodesulfobacteriota bacterium]|nr:hypothetical protein [Thermodesulfobacteriota bacterium]